MDLCRIILYYEYCLKIFSNLQVEFPKVVYNHETDEVKTSSSGSLISPHLPQVHLEPKATGPPNARGPSHTSSPRKDATYVQ